jgi:NADP-dependent aldehyde dehydrogenase
MVHGGPYPSTGHPGFTGVGIPASLARFTALQCYDNVPDHRLPPELRAANPLGLQRNIGGIWTDQPISG